MVMRVFLCLLIALVLSAPAEAAKVEVVLNDVDPDSGMTEFRYLAAPGEANRLTLSGDRTTVTVHDGGAKLTAGSRCRSRADGSATCDIRDAEEATIELRDGDDEARLTSTDLQFGSVHRERAQRRRR